MFITGNNLAILYALLHTLPQSVDSGLSTVVPAVSQTAGALLITAIWQGAIVAACLAISMKLASRLSAGLRFTLWIAGFLAVAGLPFLPPILRIFSHPAVSTGTGTAAASRFSLDYRWSIAICLLWAAVSLYRFIDLAAHTVRLRNLWLSATPVPTETAPAKLPCRRTVEICTTDALDRPSVIGFLSPRILIPSWLLSRLTPGELDQIVLHETEHLRRGDDWTNLLQKLSLILFPLNPVLLWMERRLCLEREMACDEAVIRVTHSPRDYAACLTSLAERGIEYRSKTSEALSLGAWRRRPELVHRVHSLLRRKPTLNPWRTRGLAAALTCGLILGSVELARCPQLVTFVQAPPADAAQFAPPLPSRNFGNAHAVLTSWKQPNPERSGRAHMTEVRATLPPQAYPPANVAALAASSARTLASQPTPRLTPNAAPRQVLLKAENPDQSQPQGWLVLTTWEEVSANQDAQADIPASAPAVGASSQPTAAETTPATPPAASSQIRVTRVVFRVVPASFVSPSPTAIRTRDGWLVIQM